MKYLPSLLRNSFKKRWKILFLILLTTPTFSQEKTTELEAVDITEKHQKTDKELTINRAEMERLAPHDLGHLLQYANGVTMRDYGGLGGMKTVSIRGLGGQHTRFITNGLPVYNAQNGQTDFGLVQIDNFENLAVEQGVSRQLFPVGALALGNTIALQTFENTFSAQNLSARAVLTGGSFGQLEGYGGVKVADDNKFISASGKYRQFEGEYPYQFQMGNATFEGVRRNNAFNEYFITLGGGWKSNGNSDRGRHKATFIGHIDGADKELPGAVIMYNDLADETLETQNIRAGGNYNYYGDNLNLMSFISYKNSFLHYHDPSFLNQQGFIDNQYKNHNTNFGTTMRFETDNFALSGGTDIAIDDLESNRELGEPWRFTANNMLGLHFQNDVFETNLYAFSQFYEDHNRSQYHSDQIHRLNPQISVATGKNISENWVFHSWYKQTLRPPSFNELYYSQIGNLSLDPEDAHQFNLGVVWNKSWKNYNLGISSNVYYNLIDNKILALPTQNLFVWSIVNVGNVETIGVDFQLNQTLKINENWHLSIVANATYQEVMDVSDENSPTYRHQLAYTPKFTGNITGTIYYKNWSVHNTVFGVGERFSLNENIPANRLDQFALWDVSIEYKMVVKEKHKFRIQGGVRNVTDNHYNFIRFFVMPGRNYFIKLMYEL